MIKINKENYNNISFLKPSFREALILRIIIIRIIVRVIIRVIIRVAIRIIIRGVKIFIRVIIFLSFIAGAV